MTTINTTDPRLTAFVLGELSAEEAGDIQTALDQNVELQTEVAAIREIVAQIESAMLEEDGNHRAQNHRARGVSQGSLSDDTGSVNVRSVNVRRRWLIPAVITAIAASLVVALALPLVLNKEPGTQRSAVPGFHDMEAGNVGDSRSDRIKAVQSDEESGLSAALHSRLPSDFSMDKNRSAETAESVPSAPFDSKELQKKVDRENTQQPSASEPLVVGREQLRTSVQTLPLAEQSEASSSAGGRGGMSGSGTGTMDGFGGGGFYGGGSMGMGGMGSAVPQSNPQPALSARPSGSSPAQQPARPGLESPSPPQMPAMQPYSAVPLENSQAAPEVERRFRENFRENVVLVQRDSDDRRFVQIAPPIGELPPTRRGMTPPVREPVVVNDSYNNARNEAYKEFTENDFLPVKLGEFSTFSIDVDTASYTTMRRYVRDMNRRPPVESVRLEEYLNYFTYDYAQPDGEAPFATHVEIFPCPWQSEHLLARIGIKGKEYSIEERPALNLVFLVDVSGSMAPANRLPLVKQGLTELVEKLQPKDRVAIVTYANNTALALPSVSAQEKRAIIDTIDGLRASGGTYGESGIKLAYDTARKYFDKEAQNRVILCTDGDFNIGTTDNKTLEELIAEEAKSGVFLTILGFGMGNLKDDRLKTLSMRGNGNYGYIDSIEECRKLLVEGLSSTLFTIAKDVKIQVDFNPAHVSGYRLLGYENRKLRDEDFHNDAVDAGDIGAGHTVTALYEIVPAGVRMPQAVDRSRYETEPVTFTEPVTSVRESLSNDTGSVEFADELMFVKLRYKEPDGERSSLLEYPVKKNVQEASGDSQFASAVALYGMLLRSSRHSGKGTWDTVLELAMPNTNEDKYREEFIDLVKKARELR